MSYAPICDMDTINIYFLWDIVFPSTSIWSVESFKKTVSQQSCPNHSQQQGRRCKPENVHPAWALGQAEQACFRHESRSTRHQYIPEQSKFYIAASLPTGPNGRETSYSKHAETTLHGHRIQPAFPFGDIWQTGERCGQAGTCRTNQHITFQQA